MKINEANAMEMLSRPSVVGLGELLWDMLPSGPRVGGAPANFACHAGQLGAAAAMVSRVGSDDLGDRAVDHLEQQGVASDGVQRGQHATGTVQVTLDSAGHPSYEIMRDVAWDYLECSDTLAKIAESADAVCFGSLAQRCSVSRETIQRFLATMPRTSLRVFDVNLRPPFFDEEVIQQSLELANVLKLSDEELPELASTYGLTGSEFDMQRQLASRFELRAVALTCGSRGAKLLRGEELSEQNASPTTVADTVGAGDSFTAALTIGLLAEHDLDAINLAACRIAAFVCSQAGATPKLPTELVDAASFASQGEGR